MAGNRGDLSTDMIRDNRMSLLTGLGRYVPPTTDGDRDRVSPRNTGLEEDAPAWFEDGSDEPDEPDEKDAVRLRLVLPCDN